MNEFNNGYLCKIFCQLPVRKNLYVTLYEIDDLNIKISYQRENMCQVNLVF